MPFRDPSGAQRLPGVDLFVTWGVETTPVDAPQRHAAMGDGAGWGVRARAAGGGPYAAQGTRRVVAGAQAGPGGPRRVRLGRRPRALRGPRRGLDAGAEALSAQRRWRAGPTRPAHCGPSTPPWTRASP